MTGIAATSDTLTVSIISVATESLNPAKDTERSCSSAMLVDQTAYHFFVTRNSPDSPSRRAMNATSLSTEVMRHRDNLFACLFSLAPDIAQEDLLGGALHGTRKEI